MCPCISPYFGVSNSLQNLQSCSSWLQTRILISKLPSSFLGTIDQIFDRLICLEDQWYENTTTLWTALTCAKLEGTLSNGIAFSMFVCKRSILVFQRGWIYSFPLNSSVMAKVQHKQKTQGKENVDSFWILMIIKPPTQGLWTKTMLQMCLHHEVCDWLTCQTGSQNVAWALPIFPNLQ